MVDLIPGLPDDVARECLIRVQFESFPNAVLACKNWKYEIGSPDYLHRRVLGSHSQSIMVLTQLKVHSDSKDEGPQSAPVVNRLAVCELKTGNWSELPPIPGSKPLPSFCRFAVVGLSLVVIGGWYWHTRNLATSREVYVYNFVTSTWRRGADMPNARSFFGCVSDSDRMVYVVGGHDEEKNALRSALAYDVANDDWVWLPNMATERDECRADFLSGKLHVSGGYSTDAQGQFHGSFQVFDPAKWTWGPERRGTLWSSDQEKIHVAGHGGKFYTCREDHVALLENGKWEHVADLPVCLRDVYGLMTLNKHLVVIGFAEYGEKNMVCLLDLESKKWSNLQAPKDWWGHVQFACCLEI